MHPGRSKKGRQGVHALEAQNLGRHGNAGSICRQQKAKATKDFQLRLYLEQ